MNAETMSSAPPVVRRPPLWRELAIGLLVFGFYLVVNALGGPDRRVVADRNALRLVDFEQWAHLDVERQLNDWLAPHHVLTVLANYEYAFTYIISAALLLSWLYVRLPDAYVRARNSFVLLNVLAITCFALFPLTPPRLLAESGFVDTVTQKGTAGSWGSPLVDHANQLAAMPSLHVAWALWVSVVLAWLARGPAVQVLSAIHVSVTVFVVVATANHYLVDAVAAVGFVWVSVAAIDWRHRRRAGRVPSADAFFLHVEGPKAPQHVGGMVVLEVSEGNAPSVERIRDLVREELGNLPRFRQRLDGSSRWRRPRWVDAEAVDWTWHVSEHDVAAETFDAGKDALRDVVGALAAEPLPRDRPLWRIVMVRGVGAGRSAMILLVHHCVADGIGTVVQALNLLRPHIELATSGASAGGAAKRATATVVGLGQLAADGRPASSLPAASSERRFGTAELELEAVRAIAKTHGARVTDLVLCLVATAFARVHPDLSHAAHDRLRVAVPLMVREPGSAAEGNVTAAVMIDLPTAAMGTVDRLAEIGRHSDRLRTPTRALASRFVMARGLAVLPEPCLRWFARTVYGPSYFQGIVSNMPGPAQRLSLADVAIDQVFPILPLAPGVPFALGALSWNGVLGVGLAGDPTVVDVDALATELGTVLRELTDTESGAEALEAGQVSLDRTMGLPT